MLEKHGLPKAVGRRFALLCGGLHRLRSCPLAFGKVIAFVFQKLPYFLVFFCLPCGVACLLLFLERVLSARSLLFDRFSNQRAATEKDGRVIS